MRSTLHLLLIAVLAVLFYNALLHWSPFAARFVGVAGQSDQNRVNLETFWDQSTPTSLRERIIIVGSSLSLRLDENLLPASCQNLALNGGSALTGLEILNRHPGVPHVVVIETNLILKPSDAAFVDAVASPVRSTLRKWLPSFATRFRPSNILAHWFLRRLWPQRDTDLSAPASENNAQLKGSLEQEFRARLLRQAHDELSVVPPRPTIDAALDRLDELVARLTARGATVVLLEMPFDDALAGAAFPSALQAQLLHRFPPGAFQWVRPDPKASYHAPDGYHLDSPSAAHFTARLRETLSTIP